MRTPPKRLAATGVQRERDKEWLRNAISSAVSVAAIASSSYTPGSATTTLPDARPSRSGADVILRQAQERLSVRAVEFGDVTHFCCVKVAQTVDNRCAKVAFSRSRHVAKTAHCELSALMI